MSQESRREVVYDIFPYASNILFDGFDFLPPCVDDENKECEFHAPIQHKRHLLFFKFAQ